MTRTLLYTTKKSKELNSNPDKVRPISLTLSDPVRESKWHHSRLSKMRSTMKVVVDVEVVADAAEPAEAEVELKIEVPDKTLERVVNVELEERSSNLPKTNSPLFEHSPRNCDVTYS